MSCFRQPGFWVASAVSAALCAPGVLQARPVSYVGGWTFIEETDRESTALWVHYTVSPQLSLGWRSEWDRVSETIFHGPQATVLAKRWFGENYPANIYGLAGLGVATGRGSNPLDSSPGGFVGVLADWETRRLFLSYRGRVGATDNASSKTVQAARVGVAPYIGNTGDLHTWIMLEVDHRPDNPESVGVTPLVRFFKGAALFEAGWSLVDDEPLLNLTYRF